MDAVPSGDAVAAESAGASETVPAQSGNACLVEAVGGPLVLEGSASIGGFADFTAAPEPIGDDTALPVEPASSNAFASFGASDFAPEGFADFDVAPASAVAALVDAAGPGDLADFAAFADVPQAASSLADADAAGHATGSEGGCAVGGGALQFDDDFADFGALGAAGDEAAPAQAPALAPALEPGFAAAEAEVTSCSGDDDDEEGDFGDFESFSAPVASVSSASGAAGLPVVSQEGAWGFAAFAGAASALPAFREAPAREGLREEVEDVLAAWLGQVRSCERCGPIMDWLEASGDDCTLDPGWDEWPPARSARSRAPPSTGSTATAAPWPPEPPLIPRNRGGSVRRAFGAALGRGVELPAGWLEGGRPEAALEGDREEWEGSDSESASSAGEEDAMGIADGVPIYLGDTFGRLCNTSAAAAAMAKGVPEAPPWKKKKGLTKGLTKKAGKLFRGLGQGLL